MHFEGNELKFYPVFLLSLICMHKGKTWGMGEENLTTGTSQRENNRLIYMGINPTYTIKLAHEYTRMMQTPLHVKYTNKQVLNNEEHDHGMTKTGLHGLDARTGVRDRRSRQHSVNWNRMHRTIISSIQDAW